MATRTRTRGRRPPLITSARFSKSLDADQRNRRYLASMAVRVVCLIGGVISPSPWNWVLFVGAAIIPPIAVLLANAIDQRSLPTPDATPEAEARPALPAGGVIPGSVAE